MEAQCSRSPPLAASGKGQGCLILWLTLTFTWFWSPGTCQNTPDSPHTIAPSQTVWATHTASPTELQPTGFIAETVAASRSAPGDSWSTVHLESSVRPSSEASVVVNDDGESSSASLPGIPVSESETLQSSSFVPPSIFLYSTPSGLVRVDVAESATASGLDAHQGWEHATPGVLEDSSAPLTILSTRFIDSVAASVRRDPTEGLGETGGPASHAPLSTPPEVDAGTAAPREGGGSSVVLVAPTSSAEPFPPSPSGLETDGGGIEATSPGASLPMVSASVTEMLDMNLTLASTLFQSAAGETTSSVSVPAPEVSSPGGNSSCPEREAGCVEYRGDDDEGEEERRMKIIVGAVCGALLLVVALGLFIGCVLKRRGKMASGSKIDLSSYWDDSVTLSYINGHIDIPKDSADEMISLDNDSFLNSLDSMSFTNTWTSDTSKHTNF